MELVSPSPERPAVVFGEAMIELAGVETDTCRLGVAGDTFNTGVYMARAGVPTAYMTALGDEAFSERIADALEAEDLSTDFVLRVRGGTPGLYAVSVDDEGERSFTYWRGQAAVRSFFDHGLSDDIMRRAERASLLYLSGISLSLFDRGERQRIAGLADAVRQKGGVVAFDTNYRPRGWASREAARAAVTGFAPFVTMALPTFEDDHLLFGDRSPEACTERWRDAGAEEVVVKNGPDGALTDEGWIAPPEKVRPVDTTGAGDSFNGAYLSARLAGSSVSEAALAAHRLAAKVLMTHGAILPKEAMADRVPADG
ncbi:MAG: sugar kinase [Pseudomonadota bacterium]